ncbi:MAG: tRNA pseudouridine(55) synthase TruB [Coriobacteriales bacterium]|jgi:tRNA pseudouridine55 synthase|nr:tRNA pseudouridine(55) synthase TruB [Coriobacteriales bacterium]
MKAKRGASGLSGVVCIDKPEGMTSHDVVNAVRRISSERRVGHCGTLDPSASGLLLVCVGPATRLSDYLMSQRKVYAARIVFGSATSTDDATGTCTARAAVPQDVLDEGFARATLAGCVGAQDQVPPSYSAIQVKGERSYAAARRGAPLQLPARAVEVYAAELASLGTDWWDVVFEVSKGTYVRSLARDIALGIGTFGHLGSLRRLSSGAHGVDKAHTLDELMRRGVEECWLDATAALGFPVLQLGKDESAMVADGRALCLGAHDSRLDSLTGLADGALVSCQADGALLAVYRFDSRTGKLCAQTVIPGGVKGGVCHD